MGQVWVHAALAVAERFLIELAVGPRTLEMAAALVASVALAAGAQAVPPLFLIDNHLPYPMAILLVYGEVCHRRRLHGRGRKKLPGLKPPPGLLAAVVHKERDARGNLLGVRSRRLFGRLRDAVRRVVELGIGTKVNTAHLERCNGTIRSQQARLIRRTHGLSRLVGLLEASLHLWRDVYNWTRVHASLAGRTPAMALGLTDRVWSVRDYVRHPVHVSDLQQTIWTEERQEVLTSALEPHKRRKRLPTS